MSRQRGFTLAELLVACAVLAFVMAGLFQIFTSGLKAYAIGSDRVEAQQMARLSLETMLSDVRDSCVDTICLEAVSATGFTVRRFDTRCDSAQTRITWAFGGGQLTRQVIETPAPCAVDPDPVAMAEGIGTFTLTFLDAAGNPTTVAADVRRVTIDVALTVADKNERGNSTLRGAVTLRNI